jgi:hypothetical protein
MNSGEVEREPEADLEDGDAGAPQPAVAPTGASEGVPHKCPRCGRGRLRRSHRKNPVETVRSWFGVYPYRCTECQARLFRREWKDRGASVQEDHRPEVEGRSRRRKLREAAIYVLALALVFAVLYYIMKEPAR